MAIAPGSSRTPCLETATDIEKNRRRVVDAQLLPRTLGAVLVGEAGVEGIKVDNVFDHHQLFGRHGVIAGCTRRAPGSSLQITARRFGCASIAASCAKHETVIRIEGGWQGRCQALQRRRSRPMMVKPGACRPSPARKIMQPGMRSCEKDQMSKPPVHCGLRGFGKTAIARDYGRRAANRAARAAAAGNIFRRTFQVRAISVTSAPPRPAPRARARRSVGTAEGRCSAAGSAQSSSCQNGQRSLEYRALPATAQGNSTLPPPQPSMP